MTTLQSAASKLRHVILPALAVISLILFIVSNLAPLNQNDFMYALAPAVWAQHGALYTDVPFVQVPLSIMLNWLLVAVTGNVNFFLLGRLATMVLVLLAVLLPVVGRRKTRDIDLCALYVALCLTNPFVLTNSEEIGNYSLSLLCLSAAVAFAEAPGSARWRGFAVCAAAGLATSAKLYFALMCPALLLYFLLKERALRDPVVIAACGLGFLVGFTPILYFFARDYQSFLRWNVQIHTLILPLKMPDAAVGRARIVQATLVFALQMLIPIGFVAAGAVRQWDRGAADRRAEAGRLLLLAAAYIMAVSPIFVYPQYLGPLAFLLLLFSVPWDLSVQRTRALYVILGGAMFCMQCIIIAPQVYGALRPGGSAVAQVLALQRNARQIVMNGYTCPRRFYSLAPLFLLENGVHYPPELVAGPFLMFLRGQRFGDGRPVLDLDARLKKWDPDIVLWGYYLDNPDPNAEAADRAIRDYAVGHAFVVVPLGTIKGHAIKLAYRAGCKP